MEAQFPQVVVHPPLVGRCFALFPIHSAFPRVWSSRSLLFFPPALDSCTDHTSKKEEVFYVRAVVDAVIATNIFSCQPLPSSTSPGMVTALKWAMAHADVDLEVWIRKLFFNCGNGASVVQGECGAVIRIIGDMQKEIAGYDVVVPYHASCHRCELAITTKHAFLDVLTDTSQCCAILE